MRQSKLSPVVPHIGDALIVESHDITDLCFLAEDLKALTDVQAATVLAVLHTMGVMQSRVFAVVAWIYKKRSGNPNPAAAYSFIFGQPKMVAKAHKLMDDVIRHMMTGRDMEEADSVGGFSTRELQFIANLAWAVREPVPGDAIQEAAARVEDEMTDAGKAEKSMGEGSVPSAGIDPTPQRMYPDDGGLKQQVRELEPGKAFDVIREAFGFNSDATTPAAKTPTA